MYPDQNSPGGVVPGPANQYDFITNPAPQQPKRKLIPNLGGSSFVRTIVLILGGAAVLMLLMWLVAVMFGGSNANIDNAVGITQTQQEIVRVAGEGSDGNQQTRNAAVTIEMALITQQQRWLALLADQGHSVDAGRLGEKLNTQTDELLSTARINNAFDSVFMQTMEDLLRAYAAELDNAHRDAAHATEASLLAEHFAQTQLLFEQVSAAR